MMKLHNTLTRSVDEFIPQTEGEVTLYTCGPTVYSEPHIGNWVAYIRWDILVRTLRANGYDVTRVMNITDVGHLTSDADEGEDKMEKGAKREGITAWEVADRYTNRFLEGMTALNLLPPEFMTKATEHIAEQIALVKALETKGFTYHTSDGIYYDTSKFPTYADFAHLDLKALQEGARVEVNSEKKNPTDFALWKFSPEGVKRDMEWDSPWGKGFPGWHLECSAMAMKYLGETLDIHTGGIDHIPVHHTNEIAQSEAATGKRFSNYWLHCAHLLSNGTKLSKSLENSYTLDEIAEKGLSALDFRMFILQSQYRTETNFTFENLEAAHNRLERWRAIASLRWQTHDTVVDDDDKDSVGRVNGIVLSAPHAALEALNDDLNTSEALVAVERAFDAIEAAPIKRLQHSALSELIEWIDDTLGLKLGAHTPDINDAQKQIILERERARDQKDWKRSDKLRDELAEQGVYVKDTPSGVIWNKL
jgi:cysteinyl-tRNA synthetase